MNVNPSTDKFLKEVLWLGKVIFAFFCLAALLTFVAYLSGEWLPRYDLRIVELGICESRSEFAPQSTFTTASKELYICAKAEGTTFRDVMMYLFRGDSVIYQKRVKLEPGISYLEFPTLDKEIGYSPGQYRVEIRVGRLVDAAAEFTIIEQ